MKHMSARPRKFESQMQCEQDLCFCSFGLESTKKATIYSRLNISTVRAVI